MRWPGCALPRGSSNAEEVVVTTNPTSSTQSTSPADQSTKKPEADPLGRDTFMKLLLTQLSTNLEAIISQQLIICRDHVRRPACEILRGGPVPTKFIMEGRALELGDYMKQGGNGQQTFDQDLLTMFKREQISVSEALLHASNREQLQMTLRSMGAKGAGRDE